MTATRARTSARISLPGQVPAHHKGNDPAHSTRAPAGGRHSGIPGRSGTQPPKQHTVMCFFLPWMADPRETGAGRLEDARGAG